MTVVTLSSKFQVSVPKEVRDALHLKAGQKLVFINTGTAIKLMAQPSIADLVGIARGASTAGVRDRSERREGNWPPAAAKAIKASRVVKPAKTAARMPKARPKTAGP